MNYRRCISCDVRFDSTRCSFFKVPTVSNVRDKWLANLLITRDVSPSRDSYVCEKHFFKDDVLSGSPPTLGKHGEVLIASVPYKIKRLRRGAEPTLDVANSPQESDNSLLAENSLADSSLSESDNSLLVSSLSELCHTTLDIPSLEENSQSESSDIKPEPDTSLYSIILPAFTEIPLPSPKWNWHHDAESKIIIYSSYSHIRKVSILKEIVVDTNLKLRVFGKETTVDYLPQSIDELASLINKVDKLHVCCGYPYYDYFTDTTFGSAEKTGNIMRHKECLLVIKDGSICIKCSSLEKTLFQAVTNSKKRKKYARMSPTHNHQTPKTVLLKRNKAKNQRLSRKETND